MLQTSADIEIRKRRGDVSPDRRIPFLQDTDIIRYMEIRAEQAETEILQDRPKTETAEAVSGKRQAVQHFWR